MDLFNGATEQIKGKVDFRHAYIDFSQLKVNLSNSEVVKTCPAAMGFAFAAGTTDGPGAFDFKQGDDQVTTDFIPYASRYPRLVFFNYFHCLCLFFVLIVCQGNPFWKLVRNLIKTPGKEQIDCQQPKPILLDTGEMKLPYDWAVSYSFIPNITSYSLQAQFSYVLYVG